METGFTFKNRHSSEFGITMRTTSRPIRPEMKSYKYESPLADGSYDFSAANSYGHEFYKNRAFTVTASVAAENITALMRRVSDISVWLMGKGILTFDDTPFIEWRASVPGSIDYVPERYGRKAILGITFEVEPFAGLEFGTGDGPMLDSEIHIDSSVYIGIDDAYTYALSGTSSAEIANTGDWYVRPVFTVTAENPFKSFCISCGSKSFTVTQEGLTDMVIDMNKHTVKTVSGTDIKDFDGDMFELPPGNTQIRTAAEMVSGDADYTLSVVFTSKYMNFADEERF